MGGTRPDDAPADAIAPTVVADGGTSPTLAASGGTAATLAATPSRGPAVAEVSDRYALGEVLGRGGMGEVRLAHDERIGRDVAIKLLRGDARNPDAVARFLREARVQGRLDHPAIVPVHDLGVDADGRPFFAMKRLAGTTLAAILDRLAAGDPDAAARWPRRLLLQRFAELCLAVHFAHTRGVIHRDLKPHNVVLGDFGEVYVLDWGIARIAGEDAPVATGIVRDDLDTLEPVSSATAAGAVLGTPGYMPPEQVRGEPIDARADVYALGCVLFELLALEPAHPRGPAGLDAALTAGPLSPAARRPAAEIPPELDDACRAATAPAAADRLASARELHDRIQRYLDGDRDLARRRELAAAHAQAAADRFAEGGDAARPEVMQEAGRALALDPTNAQAQAIVGRLLLEPPAETPPSVDAELERAQVVGARRQLRAVAFAYLGYLLAIPPIAWVGVRDPRPLVLIAALVALNFGVALLLVRRGERLREWTYAALALDSLLIATCGTVLGPLLFLPVLGCASCVSFIMHPTNRRPYVTLAAGVVTVTAPLVLELVGVLPSTFTIDGGAIVIRPWAIGVDPVGTVLFLAVSSAVITALAAGMVMNLRRTQEAADRRLHVQAWQLRQLVPDAVSAAPAEPSGTPTAAPPAPSPPHTPSR